MLLNSYHVFDTALGASLEQQPKKVIFSDEQEKPGLTSLKLQTILPNVESGRIHLVLRPCLYISLKFQGNLIWIELLF